MDDGFRASLIALWSAKQRSGGFIDGPALAGAALEAYGCPHTALLYMQNAVETLRLVVESERREAQKKVG